MSRLTMRIQRHVKTDTCLSMPEKALTSYFKRLQEGVLGVLLHRHLACHFGNRGELLPNDG